MVVATQAKMYKTVMEFVSEECKRYKSLEDRQVSYRVCAEVAVYLKLDLATTEAFTQVMFEAVHRLVVATRRSSDKRVEDGAFSGVGDAKIRPVPPALDDGFDEDVPVPLADQVDRSAPFRVRVRRPVVPSEPRRVGTDPWVVDMADVFRQLVNVPLRGMGRHVLLGAAKREDRLKKRDSVMSAVNGELELCDRLEKSVEFTDRLGVDTINEALAKLDGLRS